MASQGVDSDLAPSWGLCCVSSSESDQWPSVLLTSSTSPEALLSVVAAKAVLWLPPVLSTLGQLGPTA